MPDESNYGCPYCGAAMSECYLEVNETVTQNRSYYLSFDSRSPTDPDRGDESDSSGSNDPEEDSGEIRCGVCGNTFENNEFVRVTGFVKRPHPTRSREHDSVASLFTDASFREVTDAAVTAAKKTNHKITPTAFKLRLLRNALRVFLATPLPFAVPRELLTEVRDALNDKTADQHSTCVMVWQKIKKLFDDKYAREKPHKAFGDAD